jgi:GMP synthase (glutamine-hydrolysing)
MYVGKADVFNAPTVHLDEVETLAPGATVLASNAMSQMRSIELRHGGAAAWAVQYHPEYPLRELAAIVRRTGTRLIGEGFLVGEDDLEAFARDLDALDHYPACKRLGWRHGVSSNVLDPKLRTSEIANWIEFRVLPTRAKGGRG